MYEMTYSGKGSSKLMEVQAVYRDPSLAELRSRELTFLLGFKNMPIMQRY
jgi:hypothetical protein